jgi:type IV pilus assembly protein PilE
MNTQQHPLRRSRGFTLIELLCAVAVAGILSSVAYPTFQGVIHKARRSDALVAVMQVQMAQERFRSGNAAYGSLDEIGAAGHSPSRHYTLSVSANSGSGYELQAAASGAQASDRSCRVLKLVVDGFNLTQASGSDARVDNPAEVNRKCWSL